MRLLRFIRNDGSQCIKIKFLRKTCIFFFSFRYRDSCAPNLKEENNEKENLPFV